MTDPKKKKQKKTMEDVNEEFIEKISDVENAEATEEKENEEEMVTIPLKEYAAQLEELDALRVKTDEFSAGWQRERADFSNYRKRIERDQEMQHATSRIEILRRYLDVHDDIARALKNMPEEVASSSWVNGLDLILKKLNRLLEGEGVEEIDTEGKEFDPVFHEAISSEENPEFESGEIIEVVQKGYKLGDRIIRPARVRVAK